MPCHPPKPNLLQLAVEAAIKAVTTTFEARRDKRRGRLPCACCHACAQRAAAASCRGSNAEKQP